MNVKKRPPFDPSDPSLQPTRKVESMSSIAAELLLKELDAAFDDRSQKRLRSDRPPALDAGADPTWQSQPWRMTATTTDASLALPAASRPGAKTVVLLIAGALLLVAASVAVTLLVTR